MPTPATPIAVILGHGRWDIENRVFNELGNEWHADHMYYHDPQAIVAILLLLFLVYNVFHVWLARDLKPPLRARYTIAHCATMISAQFYSEFLHPT